MKRNWIQRGSGKSILIYSEEGRFEITRTVNDEFRVFDNYEIATLTVRETKREAVNYAEAVIPTEKDKARVKSIGTLKKAIEFVAGRDGDLTPKDLKEIELVVRVLD